MSLPGNIPPLPLQREKEHILLNIDIFLKMTGRQIRDGWVGFNFFRQFATRLQKQMLNFADR